MSAKKIALFGGSFNPFGRHHREVVELLLKHFDLVIIIICGYRPDKQTTNDIQPIHRAAITDLSLRGLPKDRVRVEYFDLEKDTFTRNHDFAAIFGHEGELWHVVGTDLVEKGGTKESSIHKVWQHAEEVWNNLNFAVVGRRGYAVSKEDLPPHHMVLNLDAPSGLSSEAIRGTIHAGGIITDELMPSAKDYVLRHHLYRGGAPLMRSMVQLSEPRVVIHVDEYNPRALEAAEPFRRYEDSENPNLGLVFGGDGTMIRATHALWPWRVPILGINCGHLGRNLNEVQSFDPELLMEPLEVYQLPLLYVEMLKVGGGTETGFAYNDAWVVSDIARTGQVARMELEVNGKMRMPKVMGDGMLVSTAQGSTAYAHSMGAPRLRYKSNEFLLVGNNIFVPSNFKWASMNLNSKVTVRALPESLERGSALYGHIDGRIKAGPVTQMSAWMSRYAAVELAFFPGQDPDTKLDEDQFPTVL